VVLNRLFEERAISFQTVFEAGDDLTFGNLSDTNIDSKTVFQVNAVFSAVSLIADTISTLPLDSYIRIDGQGEHSGHARNGLTSPILLCLVALSTTQRLCRCFLTATFSCVCLRTVGAKSSTLSC
jgi:hypothetical protein